MRRTLIACFLLVGLSAHGPVFAQDASQTELNQLKAQTQILEATFRLREVEERLASQAQQLLIIGDEAKHFAQRRVLERQIELLELQKKLKNVELELLAADLKLAEMTAPSQEP